MDASESPARQRSPRSGDRASRPGGRGKLLAVRAMYETLAISAPTVLEAVVGRVTMDKCDARLSRWSRRLFEQVQSHVQVDGLEHLDPAQSYILMSNHQSHYDIPALI